MFLLLVFGGSLVILASCLSEINFSKIDTKLHDTILISYDFNDEKLDQLVDDMTNLKLFVATNQKTCYGNTLKLVDQNSFCNTSKMFIEDPCHDLLIIYDEEFDFFNKTAPPYFALKVDDKQNPIELFEILTYAKKKVLIGQRINDDFIILNEDFHERRSVFNGAKIRITITPFMPFFEFDHDGNPSGIIGDALNLFQKRFNFTIDWISFHGHGTISANGSWTGAIKDLINNDLDVGNFSAFLFIRSVASEARKASMTPLM